MSLASPLQQQRGQSGEQERGAPRKVTLTFRGSTTPAGGESREGREGREGMAGGGGSRERGGALAA